MQEIIKWIQDYVKLSGKTKVVIGLSGGIDSAVVASLAVRALGAENVLPMDLSYEYKKNEHTKICNFVESLGIKEDNLDCRYLIEETVGWTLSLGINTLPRLRMTLLYAFAEENDALVIGTTNRSEWHTGYFTKWGDGGVDFEPIKHLYKTQVYDLANQLGNIPQWIIDAVPTAGLWEGQTDESELGVTYKVLDNFLADYNTPNHSIVFLPDEDYAFLVNNYTHAVLSKLTYISVAQAKKICKLIRDTEHKRVPVPSMLD